MSEAAAILGTDYTDRYDGVDAVTGALEVIPYEHHEIHAGSHYNLCDYALSVANAATIEFVITTPNTQKLLHLPAAHHQPGELEQHRLVRRVVRTHGEELAWQPYSKT